MSNLTEFTLEVLKVTPSDTSGWEPVEGKWFPSVSQAKFFAKNELDLREGQFKVLARGELIGPDSYHVQELVDGFWQGVVILLEPRKSALRRMREEAHASGRKTRLVQRFYADHETVVDEYSTAADRTCESKCVSCTKGTTQ
jgi:hypothetical protein